MQETQLEMEKELEACATKQAGGNFGKNQNQG